MMMPNEETSADHGQQDWTRGSALHHLWLQSTIRSMMTKITMTVIVVFLSAMYIIHCITLASSHTKQTSVCTRRCLFAPEDWCFHQTLASINPCGELHSTFILTCHQETNFKHICEYRKTYLWTNLQNLSQTYRGCRIKFVPPQNIHIHGTFGE